MMDDIKRQNFVRAHPNEQFPSVFPLDEAAARNLRHGIATRLRASPDDGLALVIALNSVAIPVIGVRADDDLFRLMSVFWRVRIQPRSQVYVNWYRFDRIDQIGVQDLARFFDDLWYPGSDDIDIFDDSLDWILSVTHSGDVMIARIGIRLVYGRDTMWNEPL